MESEHEAHTYARCETCGWSFRASEGYALGVFAGKVIAHHKECAPGGLWSPPGSNGWEPF